MTDVPPQGNGTKPTPVDAFLVEINGVAHEIVPTLGDLVRYERKYGDFDKLKMTAEQAAYLVWCSARRLKLIDDVDFEDFLDALGSLESVVPPKASPKTSSPKSSRRPARTGGQS